jgi:anti-sigma B factor antagonist
MMTVSTFKSQMRFHQGAAILDLAGEVNAYAEEALQIAYGLAENTGSEIIHLNFEEVHYINSTGIALIVALLSRARKNGRSLTAFGLSDHYQEIFQITRLSEFIPIYSDEVSALQSVSID